MKKKILIAVTDSNYSGAPIYVKELETILQRKYLIELIVSKSGTLLRGHELNFNTKSIFDFRDVSAIIKSLNIIRKLEPDYIWLNSFKMSLIIRLSLLFLKTKKLKIIYTVHGLSFKHKKHLRNLLIRLFEKLFLNYVDVFIFLTEYDKTIFQEKVSKKIKVKIIPNFSRLENASKKKWSEKTNNYVMIARNEPQKDYKTLFRAFSIFSINKDVRLFCFGKNVSELDALRKKLNLEKKIILSEEKSEIQNILNDSDCLILSTHYEGMPLILLEGMSTGTPIICTDVCGIHELIKPEYGMLVQPNNIQSMTQQLEKIYALNIAGLEKMGNKARDEYNLKYSKSNFRKNILDLVQNF